MANPGHSAATELGVSLQQAPEPQRRPRVREVSSRFMTPSSSRSSSSSLLSPVPGQKSRSNSVQKQRSSGHSFFPDENKNEANRASPQPKPTLPRAAAKLNFKDGCTRAGTPSLAGVDSCFRVRPSHSNSSASKLLQLSGLSPSVSPASSIDCEDEERINLRRSGSTRPLQDLHSSVSDGGMKNGNSNTIARGGKATPAIVVSSRYLTERSSKKTTNFANGVSDSPCVRSLDFPRQESEGSSVFHSLKASDRDQRDRKSNSVKLSYSGLPLAPPPSQVKLSATSGCIDTGKSKKVSGQQEDAHCLKMLYNRYLQWRFVNAKAEASFQSQQREAEKILYSHRLKLSELYESVAKKRIELAQLRIMRTLSDILVIQMPCLDEWSTFEEEYALSLSDVIQALENASIRVPLSGTVTVDAMQLKEALNSATKFLESITLHISNFLFNAERTEVLISELARLSGGERALVEECGELLATQYISHVEECSLRSQIIQAV